MSERDELVALLTGGAKPRVKAVEYGGVTLYVRECTAADTPEWVALFRRRAADRVRAAEGDEARAAAVVGGAGAAGSEEGGEGEEEGGEEEAFRRGMVALCACDAEGRRLFGPADTARLAAPPALMGRLFVACLEVNGMTEGQREAAAKKSSPTPTSA